MKVTGGSLKSRVLLTPSSAVTRPTSERLRQTVFDILQSTIEAADFLDIFAGSGAMGIEALSRGAKHATFMENHPSALRCLRQNLAQLGLESQATVLHFDARTSLRKLIEKKSSFDFIYIDPPYLKHHLQKQVLLLIDDSNLLKTDGTLFMEIGSKTSLPSLEKLKLETKRSVGSSQLFQYKSAF